eukprot:scpid109684/ scgid21519/ 
MLLAASLLGEYMDVLGKLRGQQPYSSAYGAVLNVCSPSLGTLQELLVMVVSNTTYLFHFPGTSKLSKSGIEVFRLKYLLAHLRDRDLVIVCDSAPSAWSDRLPRQQYMATVL